ncbi:hypothetical protein QYF36_015060 [Acer negundo]|nr:hypothetical protein QYF36_015060 [Acer negundo]
MLIVLTGDHHCPMFVKVSDRSRVFKREDFSLVSDRDTRWGRRCVVRPSFGDTDLKDDDVMDKGVEREGKARSRKDESKLLLRRTRGVHHIRKVLSGKLVLEKGVTDRNRGYKEDSCTSLTESSSEEGQLGTFGGNRGECSKWARVNSGDGLSKELSSPIRIQERSSSDSLIEGRGTVVRRVGPRQVLVNQNIRRVGADQVESTFRLPGDGPVHIPLEDLDGGKLVGKDLRAVPISVVLEELRKNSSGINKQVSPQIIISK